MILATAHYLVLAHSLPVLHTTLKREDDITKIYDVWGNEKVKVKKLVYRAWTVNTTLSCSQRASEMSTWVTSCTSLISRRNFVKCATHLKTVFIPTTQPHPSLTSSTACICHHLWKVELSSSSEDNFLINRIHDKPHTIYMLWWCNCVWSGKFTTKSWPWFWVYCGVFSDITFSKVGL